MNIAPEELTQEGYVLLDSLEHKEIVPFVRMYMKKRTLFAIIYLISNLFSLGLLVFYVWRFDYLGHFELGAMVNHFCYGLAIAFLLIPLHEYIHVLAYKSQGAINTSYDANLKKFYFMAIADKFVANRNEFRIVALAPFAVITSVLGILLFFVNNFWTFTILGIIMTHTAFSSGDFGLLSYFDFHGQKDVVTYDDKECGISYFYGKNKD